MLLFFFLSSFVFVFLVRSSALLSYLQVDPSINPSSSFPKFVLFRVFYTIGSTLITSLLPPQQTTGFSFRTANSQSYVSLCLRSLLGVSLFLSLERAPVCMKLFLLVCACTPLSLSLPLSFSLEGGSLSLLSPLTLSATVTLQREEKL